MERTSPYLVSFRCSLYALTLCRDILSKAGRMNWVKEQRLDLRSLKLGHNCAVEHLKAQPDRLAAHGPGFCGRCQQEVSYECLWHALRHTDLANRLMLLRDIDNLFVYMNLEHYQIVLEEELEAFKKTDPASFLRVEAARDKVLSKRRAGNGDT